MAKYRIIRRTQGRSEPQGGEQYWQEVEPGQVSDLDLEEIAGLNELPEQPQQEERPSRFGGWVMPALALIVALAFFIYMAGDIIRYGTPPDLSFLSQSHELAQDEALASLRTAVVSIEGATSLGSGFNLSAEGLIITNRHVVEDNPAVSVLFADGKRYRVQEWQYVEGYDLALAELDAADLPYLTLSDELPETGDTLIFIGNPLGFDWTISQGEMEALLASGDSVIISFSGPVRSGNSGSPLFNTNGEVVGVIYASRIDTEDSGLAIPAAVLLAYLE